MIFRFDYFLRLLLPGDCWGDPRGRPFRATNPDWAIIYWNFTWRCYRSGDRHLPISADDLDWQKKWATTRVAPTHLSADHFQNHIMLIILMCNTIASNRVVLKCNRASLCLFPVSQFPDPSHLNYLI